MPLHLPNNGGDGPRDCGTFFLDVTCDLDRQAVRVELSDRQRSTNDELTRLIDQAWEVARWQAKKTGQTLFNGELARLIDYRAHDDRLDLILGRTTFKEFVGTNQTQAYVRYVHGEEVLADPLGVSGSMRTSDGFLLMGVRSERVIQYPRRLQPVGGMVEPTASNSTRPDPFQTMLDEILEETGLGEDRVREIRLVALVRDKNTVQPELIFDVDLDVDAEAVRHAAERAEDGDEHSSLIPVRDHPAAVVTFLEKRFSDLTPVGLATLLMHGLRHWGSGWFAGARGYLRSVI